MRKVGVILIFGGLICCWSLNGQTPEEINDDGKKIDKPKLEKTDYIPEVHGTVRAKYEYEPQINKHRFQVRNARLSITGNVLPIVAYKLEVDLSDEGRMRMLDAYGRVFPVEGLALTFGQTKIPFSTDNLRSPHNFYFANRSFIAKQVTGFRDVGFMASYEYKQVCPFQLTAGVFNGSGLLEQREWHAEFSYAARLVLMPVKWINFALNFQSIEPESLRMNLYDVSLFSDFYGVHLEAEYLYKTYGKEVFVPTQAFSCFAVYDLPLPKVFIKISFLVRYDMMTANSDGYLTEEKSYVIDDIARHRITAGVTLSLGVPFQADLRVNYEQYFYEDWHLANESQLNKIVAEVVVRF